MPVAIRKRSWEEHVTHASGLQYSYDDLDLVCCHGVDDKGSRLGLGSSKQGQRTRCASMPEGCHQLPTEELSQTFEVTAAVVNDETKVFKLMQNSVKVPLGLEEELAHSPYDLVDVDIPRGASESEHLQTTNTRSHGEPHCNLNSGLSVGGVAGETARERATVGEGEATAEGDTIGKGDHVFKCPHITHDEQQCISVPSNNEPLLAGCAGEQPGTAPSQQETMENHAEGYSRPPETFDITINQSSAAGVESPNDLPDAEGKKISTSGQADARLIPPFGEQGRADSIMENGDEMSQASETMEPFTTSAEEERGTESRSSDSVSRPDGFNPEHQSRSARPKCNTKTCGEGVDQVRGGSSPQVHLETGEARVRPSGEGTGLGSGIDGSSGDCSTPRRCISLNEKADVGYSGGAAETNLETSARDAEGGSSVFDVSTRHQNQITAPQFENSCLKLDTIPEVGHNVLHDTPVHPCEDSNLTPNPDVQRSYVDGNYITTEKVSQNPGPRSAEDCDERLPQHLHSNHGASGCHFSESPGSEVADGYSKHATVTADPGMKEEAVNLVAHSDAQLPSPGSTEINHGAQKEGDAIKIRTKKVRLF